jgi:dextranase
MNYNVADGLGYFNTPGVLLTDAVMFALGASHLELGEHMLGKEYFPNSNLVMKPELKEALVHYYDFLVGYENLLRDGGSFDDLAVTSVNSDYKLTSWPPQTGKLTTLTKMVGNRQVVHVFNLIKADSTSWRDIDGTMPEPDLLESVVIDIPTQGTVKRVWMATPDHNGGALEELTFKEGAGKVRVSIPHLKYWDMIVMEY